MKSESRVGMTAFGAPHRHHRLTDSTNARARELAEAGAPGGTVVTAEEQTAGRGRQGRSWTAPAGKALLYSAIVRPLDERHLLLPLSAPLAVCAAAEELQPGTECQIKWPNDIWVGGRKLAGVLIEARMPGQSAEKAKEREPTEAWAVVGVGLNLAIERHEFPDELRETAVSLDVGASATQAKAALDRGLERWALAEESEILAAWRERDALRGREVAWGEESGVADGIDDRGSLLVVTDGGVVSLGAGEVHLRL